MAVTTSSSCRAPSSRSHESPHRLASKYDYHHKEKTKTTKNMEIMCNALYLRRVSCWVIWDARWGWIPLAFWSVIFGLLWMQNSTLPRTWLCRVYFQPKNEKRKKKVDSSRLHFGHRCAHVVYSRCVHKYSHRGSCSHLCCCCGCCCRWCWLSI